MTPFTRTLRRVCVGLLLASPMWAFAAGAPSVASFTTGSGIISSGDAVTLSWRIVGGSGSTISFACPAGVSVKRLDGTTVPCNTRVNTNAPVFSSATFKTTNTGGTQTAVVVTLYPKDSTGNDYDAGAVQTSFVVNTAAHPIVGAFASTTATKSGAPLSVTWTAPDLTAANLQFDCKMGLRYTQADGITPLPCGIPAFATALPMPDSPTRTASAAFVIYNDADAATSTTIRILPAIDATRYDLARAATVPVSVGARDPQQIAPLNTNTGTTSASLTAASTVSSDLPMQFSWTTQNSVGANLVFSCNDALTYEYVGISTHILPCALPAFTSPLPVSGAVTLEFINHSSTSQPTSLAVLPQRANGVYDTGGGTNATLLVLPGAAAIATVGTSATNIVPTTNPAASTAIMTVTPTVARTPITLPLKRGSRGAQVSILQTFLAQDPAMYPEGDTTGYYGAATARAVGRFQERYHLTIKSDPSYGSVGPNTRAKINTLLRP